MGRLVKFFVDALLVFFCYLVISDQFDLSFLNLPFTNVPVSDKTSNSMFYVTIGVLIAHVLFNGLFAFNIVLLILLTLVFKNWLVAFVITLIFRLIRTVFK